MNLQQFRQAIAENPDCALRIAPAGAADLAEHFHVTEVGRVQKDFLDCGGVLRSEVRCVLQTLVAGDVDHRLSSTKLTKILALTDRLDLPADAPVEVEHQQRSITVDAVESVERVGDTLVIHLAPKHTACLAEDACGIPRLTQFAVLGGSSGPGCC